MFDGRQDKAQSQSCASADFLNLPSRPTLETPPLFNRSTEFLWGQLPFQVIQVD